MHSGVMVRPRGSRAVSLAMLAALAGACAPADRDLERLARSALMRERPVVFRERSLIVVIPRPEAAAPDRLAAARTLAAFDTTITRASRVATPLGYRVALRYGSAAHLIDLGSHAVYEPPRDVSMGYIIVAPRLTPLLIRGYLPDSALAGALSRYGQPIVRPLET